ncbi:hypothetical protein KI387_036745, partial [Taxus chinensis]
MVDLAKVTVIVGLRETTSQSIVHGFLGHIGYYKKFIKGYAKIATPLEELLRHKCTFHWGKAQQRVFDTLKDRLITIPILRFPSWDKPFHVHVDASRTAIGAVLAQP